VTAGEELLEAKRRLRAWLRGQPAPRGAAAQACARSVARHLALSPELARARRVALFAALPDEPPTRFLFDLLIGCGRTPFFPRALPGNGLDFAPLARWDELRRGPHGVLEPSSGAPGVGLGPGDLVVVPGIALDRRGGRLGRGGGHYDRRFPPGAFTPILFGLAFGCRLIDGIPSGAHDCRMDAILTEHGLLRVSRRTEDGDR
jgi:5-formyltetrahydrofolate cyclo-ligase